MRLVNPLPVLVSLKFKSEDEPLASMVDTKDDTERASDDSMPLVDVKMTHESNVTLGKMTGKRS